MRIVLCALFLGTASCSDSAGDSDTDAGTDLPGTTDGVCAMDESVGGIVISLEEGFTSVQGKIESSVAPFTNREVVTTAGECSLLKPVTVFCDPSCIGTMTCGLSGVCVDAPVAISVGDVSVFGLSDPVEMSARAPVFFYTNTGTLANPAFAKDDPIHMQASGEVAGQGFGLDVSGIAPIELTETSVELADGQPIAVSWTESDEADTRVRIVLNIAQHGGTPGSIECDVPDDGMFTIPESLTSELLARGFSGFPSLSVTRHSTDSTVIPTGDSTSGCVEFSAQSKVTVPVVIDGLTSCSVSDNCPDGQVCGPDLSCQSG